MKFKVKITGMEHGRLVKFNHTFETPEFYPEHVMFMGKYWVNTVIQQQDEWLSENYHLVIDECEKRDLWPIIGYEIINPKVRVNKKEKIKKMIQDLNLEPEMLAMVIGTMNRMWPTIKKLSIVTIVTIVFESISVTSTVTTAILKNLKAVLDGGSETIEINENETKLFL